MPRVVSWGMATHFHHIAEFYEALFDPDQRLAREGPFIEELLHEAPGPSVLDLACGTGIHALFLAEHGAQVTARDLSAGMIEVARRKRPHPSIRYQEGDMCSPPEGPWDLVLCLGNSLALLPDEAHVRRFLDRACRVLAPGGRLCFQILNFSPERWPAARHHVARREGKSGSIVAVKSLVPGHERILLGMHFHVRLEDGTILQESDHGVLLPIRQGLIEAWAKQLGLTGCAWFGGFDGAPFSPSESNDLIGVFIKAC